MYECVCVFRFNVKHWHMKGLKIQTNRDDALTSELSEILGFEKAQGVLLRSVMCVIIN